MAAVVAGISLAAFSGKPAPDAGGLDSAVIFEPVAAPGSPVGRTESVLNLGAEDSAVFAAADAGGVGEGFSQVAGGPAAGLETVAGM